MSESTLIWRTAGGNAARQGLFERHVEIADKPFQSLTAAGAVQAAVVFDQAERAFVADMTGSVHAFSAAGQRLWRVDGKGGISATPAVHSNQPLLFIGTHTGLVRALDTATGAVVWERELPTKTDPRILSDLLYAPEVDWVVLSSWGGKFVALDAATGQDRFSWDAGISPFSAAALRGNGDLFFLRAMTGRGTELVRIKPDGTESVLHRIPEGKRGAKRTLVTAAPVLDEARGMLYVVANQDRGCALLAWSLSDNKVAWTRELEKSVQATPCLRPDGGLLVADLGATVRSISVEGKSEFEYTCGSDYLLASAAVERGGNAFIGDPLGTVHQIGPGGNGRGLFNMQRSIQARLSFSPAGHLYVPCTNHTVFVFPGKLA